MPHMQVLCSGISMQRKSALCINPRLLRATCMAVIMAQMGCPVAAAQCQLSPADCIFTRLGASDRIMVCFTLVPLGVVVCAAVEWRQLKAQMWLWCMWSLTSAAAHHSASAPLMLGSI